MATYSLYWKPKCPWSQKAHQLLTKRRKRVQVFDVDSIGGLQTVLLRLNLKKHKTVPIVYKDDKFIGGFTELSKNI